MKAVEPDSWEEIEKNIRSGDTILILFTAPWCKSCGEAYKAVEDALSGCRNLKIYLIDVSKNPEWGVKNNILAVPTLLVYIGGALVDRFTGVPDQHRIREIVCR